jgi:hypothetical protein
MNCSVDGCKRESYARTFCRAHYARWQRNGDPMGGRPPPGDHLPSERPCEQCGVAMHRRPNQFPSDWRDKRFCSRSCISKATNAKYIKSNDQLRSEIEALADPKNPDLCWLYEGALSQGYGRITHNMKSVLLHRVCYEIFIGPIPKGDLVCHSCDVRRCLNPRHFFLGTNTDNTADRDKKNRQAKGEKSGRAKLTEIDVISIRAMVGVSIKGLSMRFGVSASTINAVKTRKTWTHV